MTARCPGIGVAAWSLPPGDPFDLACYVGADHLAVDLGPPTRAARRSHRERLLASRLRCPLPVSSVAVNLFNDVTLWGEEPPLAILSEAVDLARHVDAPIVFVPGFRDNCPRTEAEWGRTVEVLRAACEAFPDQAIGYETPLGPASCTRLVAEVGHAGFRLVLDPFNLGRAGHALAAWLSAAEPALADEIHVKDGRRGARGFLPLGAGDLDPARLMRRLAALLPRRLTLEGDRPYPSAETLAADLDRLRCLAHSNLELT